ncbi:hypothetical protein EAF04_005855 [Stromatinia cepivora]|nr:hypothetical protein EAF04_005855 [Stromatinia cepivora]
MAGVHGAFSNGVTLSHLANEALDTIRVFVKLGEYDPMSELPVTVECPQTLKHRCAGLTPLDIYNGPPEAYSSLLEQDKFVVSVESVRGIRIMEKQLHLTLTYMKKLAEIMAKKKMKRSFNLWHQRMDFQIICLCNMHDLDAAAPIAFLFLEEGLNARSADGTYMTPFGHLFAKLDPCAWRSDAENLAKIVMIWFCLLRKTSYDMREYLAHEPYLHQPDEIFEHSARRTDVKYIRLEKAQDSDDMIFISEMYDLSI